MPMVTNLGRVVAYHGWLPQLYNSLIIWSFKVIWQTKTIISTTRVSLATKHGRMATCLDELLPIKFLDS